MDTILVVEEVKKASQTQKVCFFRPYSVPMADDGDG